MEFEVRRYKMNNTFTKEWMLSKENFPISFEMLTDGKLSKNWSFQHLILWPQTWNPTTNFAILVAVMRKISLRRNMAFRSSPWTCHRPRTRKGNYPQGLGHQELPTSHNGENAIMRLHLNQSYLTLFLQAKGRISPYMSVTWPSPGGNYRIVWQQFLITCSKDSTSKEELNVSRSWNKIVWP